MRGDLFLEGFLGIFDGFEENPVIGGALLLCLCKDDGIRGKAWQS